MDPILEKLDKNVETVIASSKEAKETAEKAAKAASETAASLVVVTKDIADIKGSNEEKAKADAENQKALNTLITEVKTLREGGISIKDSGAPSFTNQFADLVKEKHAELRSVSKGKKFSDELKGGLNIMEKGVTPVNMTTASSLSGQGNVTFMPKPALLPAQKINVRDLISSFQSDTLTINLYRESDPSPYQGNFAQQLTEGAIKNQIQYQYNNVAFTASYIAGFVKFAKQMMYNLPWLQTYLPQQLIRDFYKTENATFYAQLIAAATASTLTTGGNVAERLIQVIANIESTNFTVDGIVVHPQVWAALMLTTVPTVGTSYSIPGGVQIMPNGQMMIAGIPILKATWVKGPAGTSNNYALVGDFTMAAIAQVENLKVEFFEQDSDNVEKNLITCRVEALEVLVIEQPAAFASKDTTSNS